MGPGSVLGGRYLLARRLDVGVQTSTWQARDQTLDRQVHLRAVANTHPFAEAVLDAARRACHVEDPRLVRILDVGRDAHTTFIVGEWLPSPCLTDQLAAGPLPAEAARVVVGEVALALEAARHRGLHHLRLTPESVHLLDDGTVRVTNLATAAALDGIEHMDGDEATRRDTHDLVAVCYAALTGTWPLATASDLPRAPQVGSRPVPPAQLVSGAPADLDLLCAQAFSGGGVPSTPGELAAQIAPWGRDRPELRHVRPVPHATAPPATAPPHTTVLPSAPVPYSQDGEPTMISGSGGSAGASPSAGTTQTMAPFDPAARTSVLQALGVDRQDEGRRSERRSGRKQQSRTVMVLVIGFVAIFLLLAYCGLRDLGGSGAMPVAKPSRTPSATPSSTDSEAESPAPSSSTRAPAPATVQITTGRGFDPEGDGSEKDRDAAKAFDGDVGTSWTSQTYRSVEFGGLKKGVGVLLDLGGPHRVTQVQLTLAGGPQSVELHAADGDDLGPAVLASAADASGSVTLRLSRPTDASQLVLWFTRPAPADGGYRASVSEVAVS